MRIDFLLLSSQRSPQPCARIHPSSKCLNQQQAAWNRHDLEAFMSGYWNSPTLTFFGSKENFGLAGNTGSLPQDLPERRP